MKNKISFISELLNSNKISASQKERILILTKKELNLLGDSNAILHDKISEIEKKIEAIHTSNDLVFSNVEIDKIIDNYFIKNSIIPNFNSQKTQRPITKFDEESMANEEVIFQNDIEDYEAKENSLREMAEEAMANEEAMIQDAIEDYETKENTLREMVEEAMANEEAMIQDAVEDYEAKENSLREMAEEAIANEEAMIQDAIEDYDVKENSLRKMAEEAMANEEAMNQGVLEDYKNDATLLTEDHIHDDKNKNVGNSYDIQSNYMSPRDLKNFLIEYNQNEILKYTCHLIDGDALIKINSLTKTVDYDFQKHLKIINKEFFKLISKYKEKINKNIHGLIGEYLNNYTKKGWSSNQIKITWSSPELLTWSRDNPGKCPNPDPTLFSTPFNFQPFKISNGQIRLQRFDDLVLHFKFLFHIRRDNSLKASIDSINNYHFSNITIIDSTSIRENIEFFTDIDKVKQSYKRIIEMCYEFHKSLNRSEKPNFKLSLVEDNDTIIFSIHHINSVFGKTPTSTIRRPGEKTTKLIDNQINGVCDLILKADFGNNDYAEINLWNGKEKKIKKIDTFEGVQFDLIFYR
jgi:hypothetical protein